MFKIPTRDLATPSTLIRPIRPAQAGAVATAAEQVDECLYQDALATYEAELERAKFDQIALDMQYKAWLADYGKGKAANVRNTTRGYDLLMSQYCSDVMKKQLESQPG